MKAIKKTFITFIITFLVYHQTVQSHSGHEGVDPDEPVASRFYQELFKDVRNIYTEPGSDPTRELVGDYKGEKIDPFSGLLQLNYTDIKVPINGALSLSTQRNYLGIQPRQFEGMTAIQRNVNGLGWQMNFGRLVSPSLNNFSVCQEPEDDPVSALQSAIDSMQSAFEIDGTRTEEGLLNAIDQARKQLSQRVLYSDEVRKSLKRTALIGAHDFSISADDIDEEEYDLSDKLPGNDTSPKELAGFFITLLKGLAQIYTTSDSIAFEFPDGSRQSFFRDDVANDGSLLTLSRIKLRCENNQMVVIMPNGTKYFATEYESFVGQRQPSEYDSHLYWGEPSWWVSKIQDVHGNTIDLTYNENALGIKYLTHAQSSDTNALSITYSYEDVDTDQLKLVGIESGDRRWEYQYITAELPVKDPSLQPNDVAKKFNLLNKVVRSDGRAITYRYDISTFQLLGVTTEYGLDVSYTYQDIDSMPQFPDIFDGYKIYSAIATKELSGDDTSHGKWQYDFYPDSIQLDNSPRYDRTRITSPVATKDYYFHGAGVSELTSGGIESWNVELQSRRLLTNQQPLAAEDSSQLVNQINWSFSSDIKLSTQTYASGADMRLYVTSSRNKAPFSVQGETYFPVVRSQLSNDSFDESKLEEHLQGNVYGVAYGSFDEYGFSETITELATGYVSSNYSNRVTTIDYAHDTENWILGLPASEHIVEGDTSILSEYSYKADTNLLTSKIVANNKTEYQYYENGELSDVQDANGNMVTYGEYKNGTPTIYTNAERERVNVEVNPSGTIASITDALNHKTEYSYDALDRVVTITPPINEPTTISYPLDTFKVVATRGGLVTSATYDVRERPVESLVDDIKTTYSYDLVNRITFVSDPGKATGKTYFYDALGRPTKVLDQEGNAASYEYDNVYQKRYIDRKGNIKESFFSRLGFAEYLTEHEENIGARDSRLTKFNYNVLGQTTKIYQSLNGGFLARSFNYDDNFFLAEKIEPEIGSTKYLTDNIGNIVSSTIQSTGEETAYKYDKANRLIEVDYPNGTADINYIYFANGLLEEISSGDIVKRYQYDNNNNLTKETLQINNRFPRNLELNYDYNSLDNLTRISYPDGTQVNLAPDSLGRPTQVGDFATNINFTDFGQLTNLTLGNGKLVNWEYDQRLLPTSINSPSLVNLAYGYDHEGNVSSINNLQDSTHNVTFGQDAYDGLNRLRKITTDNQVLGDINYAYDAQGNLAAASFHKNGQLVNTNYFIQANADSHVNLLYVQNSGAIEPNISLSYDGYGNVINKREIIKTTDNRVSDLQNKHFVFDDASRLKTVKFSGSADQTNEKRVYSYDGHKHRVISEVPNTFDVRYSFYSMAGDLMYQESISTCEQTANIRLGTLLLAQQKSANFDANADTDNDTLNDCLESVFGLDPADVADASADNDNDGISNADEILLYGSLIDNPDSDQDDISDGDEVAAGTNPARDDTDGDGLTDSEEAVFGTSPANADTDHDGINDQVEVAVLELDHLDPSDGILDLDTDGFSNRQEALLGFDPSSSASTPINRGSEEWRFDGLGLSLSAPSIDSLGIIYYATENGNIYSVYPDGTLKWQQSVQGAVYGSIVVDEDRGQVVVADDSGLVTALDIHNGNIKWEYNNDESFLGSPARDYLGRIFVASTSKVLALTKDGSLFWSYDLSGNTYVRSRIALGMNDYLYVGDSSGTLSAIDTKTGALIFERSNLGDLSESAPILHSDDLMFLVNATGDLHALSSQDGSSFDAYQLPYLDANTSIFSSPSISANNILYIGTTDEPSTITVGTQVIPVTGNKLYAFDVSNPDNIVALWNQELQGIPSTPIVTNNGSALVMDSIGYLTAYDAQGQQLWLNSSFFGAGVLGSPTQDIDGTIYVVSNNGALIAVSNVVPPEFDSWSGLGRGTIMSSHQCQQRTILLGMENDQDSDGFPDCYEAVKGLLINDPSDGQLDSDGDGLTDGQEYLANTDPTSEDSDNDGILDGDEVANGTNPNDRQPSIEIRSPTNDVETFAGHTIEFVAYAHDYEDGRLRDTIVWQSDIQGQLYTGELFDTNVLNVGLHTISASVTDSSQSLVTATIQVTVNENLPPNITILSPDEGNIFQLGDTIEFQATAIDPNEGDITSQIKWSSSQDGALGVGGVITANTLAIGNHQITLSVQDSVGLETVTNLSITINYDPQADPDGDGLATQTELDLGTNPIVKDTDHDGLDDGTEISLDTNPLHDYGEAFADYDADGYSNRQELAVGTDLLSADEFPENGALMWQKDVFLGSSQSNSVSDQNRTMALTPNMPEYIYFGNGSVYYPDGTIKATSETSLNNIPTISQQGDALYGKDCSLVKINNSGEVLSTTIVDRGALFSDVSCSLASPVIGDDGILIVSEPSDISVTIDDERYEVPNIFAVNQNNETVMKKHLYQTYGGLPVVGPQNTIFVPSAYYSAIYGLQVGVDSIAESSSGFTSGNPPLSLDLSGNLYISYNKKMSNDLFPNWESYWYNSNGSYINKALLIDNTGFGYRQGFKIDLQTGESTQNLCEDFEVVFIGKNDLLYGFQNKALAACDKNANLLWSTLSHSSLYAGLNPYYQPYFAISADGTFYRMGYDTISAYVTDSQGLANAPWPRIHRDNQNSRYQSGVLLPDAAQIVAPQKGRRISVENFTLSWNDAGADSYRIRVGSQTGLKNLVDVTLTGDITSYDLSQLVSNGQVIYVTLDSNFGSDVVTDSAIYQTVATDVSPTAVILSPVDGTTLDTAGPTFTWNDVGADKYRFWFGTSVGAKDIKVASAGAMKTSKRITGLPLDGSTLYLRFFTKRDDEWTYHDYQYTSHTDSEPQVAQLLSPLDGTFLDSPNIQFTWQDVNAEKYRFWFGTSIGANDIKIAWANGTKTSKTINDLPLDGSSLYLRFFTKKYGQWQYRDYRFTAHTDLSPQLTEIITPVSGSTLNSPHIDFTWQDIGADEYRLWLGTEPGSVDIKRVKVSGDVTTKRIKHLPHNGEPIYFRLGSKKYGRWQYNDYVYTAHTDTVGYTAELTSHADGAILSGDTVEFVWTDVQPEFYRILVGTTLDGREIAVKKVTEAGVTRHTVTGLPTDGSTVYVKLVTKKYGVWTNHRYQFTAHSN